MFCMAPGTNSVSADGQGFGFGLGFCVGAGRVGVGEAGGEAGGEGGGLVGGGGAVGSGVRGTVVAWKLTGLAAPAGTFPALVPGVRTPPVEIFEPRSGWLMIDL